MLTLLERGNPFPGITVARSGGGRIGLVDRYSGSAPSISVTMRPLMDGGGSIESTDFVLDPASEVVISAHLLHSIGRHVPADVPGTLRYLREPPPAA